MIGPGGKCDWAGRGDRCGSDIIRAGQAIDRCHRDATIAADAYIPAAGIAVGHGNVLHVEGVGRTDAAGGAKGEGAADEVRMCVTAIKNAGKG